MTGSGQIGMTKVGTRGDAMQRAAQAWHLRVLGKTWAEIAEAVGFANDANAIRAVRRFVGRLPEPSADEARTVWRERMEYLWSVAARDAAAGRPGALRAGVAVADRASKLDGLDAPQRFAVTPNEAELNRLVDMLVARSGHEEISDAEVIDLDIVPAIEALESDIRGWDDADGDDER
ncbi:hypothetical protein ACFC3F_06605 [Microbacterium sp. NPDC055910]|uniref:hypothetical protein n=1 Tax=Microbacterium sp. NPDC055910 TaxID=3345659 RepID=UPI0035DAC939